MAHFAEIDAFHTVIRVIVVNDNDIKDSDGVEQENIGKDLLHGMFGGTWILTSFNTRGGKHQLGGTPFRKNFAFPGSKYDTTRDAFLSSNVGVYPSWVLNEDTCQYEAPIAEPDDDKKYIWNEATTAWVEE